MKPTTIETLLQDQKERIQLKNEIYNNNHINHVINFIDEINNKIC